MTYPDPLGRPRRPAHLRPVPDLTPAQQAAIDRGMHVISGGQATPPYRSYVSPSAEDAILRAISAVTLIGEVAEEIGLNDPLSETVVGEHGIEVHHCPACGGDHFTDWDRIVVGTGRTFAEGRDVYIATWGCPHAAGQQIQERLTAEDFADAIDGGAELMDDVAEDATVLRFARFLEHPAVTATAIGNYTPKGDGPGGPGGGAAA